MNLSPRLLIRPRHVRHESLRGYVSRVSHLNGSSPLLKPTFESLHATTTSLSEIASLTQSDPHVLGAHCSLKINEQDKSTAVIFGDALMSANQIWMQRRHLCPLCISDDGISQCYWELCEYDVCHIHRCYLVGKCHACDRPFKWECASKERCECGVQFAESKTKKAPRSRIARCRLLANAASKTLYRPSELVKINGAITPLDWFFLIEKFIIHVLIPGFSERMRPTRVVVKTNALDELIVAIQYDVDYCRYLRQTIFLHAASNPMTMAQTLRSDISPDKMKVHFWSCLDEIIFHDALFTITKMRGTKKSQEIIQAGKHHRSSHNTELRRIQDFLPSDFGLEEGE